MALMVFPDGLCAVVSRFLCIGILMACGTSASYQPGRYSNGDVQFTFSPLGQGWERIDLNDQNDLAFEHPSTGSILQINGTCKAATDAPLTSLTQHLLIGFRNRELLDETHITLDGREALRTHHRATLDGIGREIILIVSKKNGCIYDLAFIASAITPEALTVFDGLVTSFRTFE